MKDETKANVQLTNKLAKVHKQVADLEKIEIRGRQIEDELRTNEEKYRILFEQSPNAIVIIDSETTLPIEFNDKMPQLLGYTREEFAKLRISDYEATESPEKIKSHIEKVLSRGRDKFETRLLSKNGKLKDVIVSVQVIKFSGKPVLHNIITDITEHKKSEEALLAYQKRLEAVRRIGTLANSSLNLQKVLNLILTGTISDSNATVGMIFLKDSNTGCLTWGASLGLSEAFVKEYKERPIQPGEGLTGRIAQTGDVIYIPRDSSHDPRIARSVVKNEGLNSFIGVPIYDGNTVVAVMNLLTRPPDILTEEDISLASAIGVHVGSAIRNAQLFEERKQAEEALKAKNVALRELIEQIDIEKNKLKEDIAINIDKTLLPIISKLKVHEDSLKYIDLLKYHLKELTSSFGLKITEKSYNLTPREIEICSMIKGGLTSKEICNLLNISPQTVEKHRKNIRKKVGLSNKKINLTSFLYKL